MFSKDNDRMLGLEGLNAAIEEHGARTFLVGTTTQADGVPYSARSLDPERQRRQLVGPKRGQAPLDCATKTLHETDTAPLKGVSASAMWVIAGEFDSAAGQRASPAPYVGLARSDHRSQER